ncbi:MAG TPA: alpha-L-fucosidase [Verrucomicrobiae bacterium]|nr:alpha-L-fucosidase [Verrucomicrobiae bacterium]
MKSPASMTRRDVLKLLACAAPAVFLPRVRGAEAVATEELPKIFPGPFAGTSESLRAYRCPDWFRDAKFGMWAHWGPQSAPEDGDWYARNLYLQGTKQYKSHLERYGHPTKFGYKDIIPTWKGEQFDPDHLVGLYKKAGAKYFMSMGVHVDNFDMWDSKYQRWNAAKMGVKRDVVGEFRRAAQRQGLKFGVSDHLWMAYKWMSVAHGSDKTGPLAGVPYDGIDPAFNDLYGGCPEIYRELPWDEDGIPDSWKRTWFLRIQDLVNQHEPDVLYSDGQIPFGEWGLNLVAHFYNQNLLRNDGRMEGVYTSKRESDSAAGMCVFDKERGVVDGIWAQPWQTDSCVGHWHYDRNVTYKTPKRVIDMLVDVVSRNGNLLLNFPLNTRGALDAEEQKILAAITAWMGVNGEAIHGTRPWKIFGEGPNMTKPAPGQKYNESNRKDFTFEDVRFTTKGKTLYAFFMGWPEQGKLAIPALAQSRPYVAGKIQRVKILGGGKLVWKHGVEGLTVQLPAEKPCEFAGVLKIEGLET